MANLDTVYDIDHRTEAFERHERGLLVCLAGPGTGKTFSLLARSQALADRGADPDSICYLTFIREIATAFVEDYVQRFGEEAAATSAPRISTLHSLACRIIRNQGYRAKYDGELYFTNLADNEIPAKTFLQDALPSVTRDGCRTLPQLRSLMEVIKKAWQDNAEPVAGGALAAAISPNLLEVARCYRLLDWDQTIPLATSLLADQDEPPEWLAEILHYFVDEYQDFNRAEQHLIAFLARRAESVVIVGDDDQSLYSARGGSPEGIRALYADSDNDVVTLVKCYRCKANIVTPANRFEASMTTPARPMTPASVGGEVSCLRFKSSKAEVAYLNQFLSRKIAELPEDPNPKDGIICLFPSKRILLAYFEMLSPLLPCARRELNEADDRNWLSQVLTLLVRRNQRFVERLLLNYYRTLKPRHRADIVRYVVQRDISPAEACATLIAEGAFSREALAAAQAYVDFCNSLSNRDLPAVAREIASSLHIDEAATGAELDGLLAAGELERADLIERVCDTLLPSTVTPRPDPRKVMFLTMHGSKGLTRRTVVLPGIEQACLPGGGGPAVLAEKKRLFFVALSRASDCLLITFPHNRGGNDRLNFAMHGRGQPSAFLAAAGLAPRYHP